MNLDLLVKDNEISDQYKFILSNDIISKMIWELFDLILLPQYFNNILQSIFEYTPKKRNDIIILSMKLYMFLVIFNDSLLKVNRIIHLKYPLHEKNVYRWYDKNNNITHFFIYKEESGLQKDLEKGNTEKMRKTAFSILKEKDFFGYLNYEEYQPVFTTKNDLSNDDLFGISRENALIPLI